MTLLPVKFLWPVRLDPEQTYSFTVEDEIRTVKAIFDPLLRLYNTSSNDVNLKITHILELGFGDDPLYSGSWSFLLVDNDVPTLTLRDFDFTPQIDNDTVAKTSHTIAIKNLSLLTESIVRFILFGTAEVSVRLDASQEIIRAPVA